MIFVFWVLDATKHAEPLSQGRSSTEKRPWSRSSHGSHAMGPIPQWLGQKATNLTMMTIAVPMVQLCPADTCWYCNENGTGSTNDCSSLSLWASSSSFFSAASSVQPKIRTSAFLDLKKKRNQFNDFREKKGPFLWSFDLGLIVKKTFLIHPLHPSKSNRRRVSTVPVDSLESCRFSCHQSARVAISLGTCRVGSKSFWHNLQVGGSSQLGRVWKGITPVLCRVGLGRTTRYCTWTGSSPPSICQSRTSHLKGWKCRGPKYGTSNTTHDLC